MKPIRIAVTCLAAGFLIVGIATAGAVETTVVLDEGNRIILEYRFGDYTSNSVSINGDEYLEIGIPGEPVSLVKGAPALPHVNRSLIIPGNAKMTVRLLDAKYEDSYALIAPSKGNLSRSIDPREVPYEFGREYKTNALYPAEAVELHRPYILRDHRGIVLQVNPFRYNPLTGVLREYSEMTVEITSAGPGEVNVIRPGGRTRSTSRAFNELYRAHFLNYLPANDSRDFDEEGEMLIICHDDWIANMAPFVSHKVEAAGIPTTIVGVSTIGNTHSDIKNHILGAYNSSDLAFVLLVGDIAQVDSPDVWANGEWGASDPSYSQLAGGDDYPDILVGRFSASSAAHVDTMVQRTIDYETMPATSQDWYWKATGIGSDEGAGNGDEGQADWVHQDEIRGWLLGAGYTAVDQIYDPGASDTEVANALNAGRGLVNYTGHGYSGGWGTTGFNSADVNALTNTGMLPVVFSVACNNGEFENYSSCFCETWLRATHNGAPSGAATCYGSSVLQSWAPPMEAQDEFNLLIADPAEPYHNIGALYYAGSCSMMDAYGGAGVEMFETWGLFGDPSLRFIGVITPPTGLLVEPAVGMSAEGEAGGLMAPDTMQYTLINQDEEPLEFEAQPVDCWLSVDQPTGTLPPLGSTVVTVTINETACNLDNGRYTGRVEFNNLSRLVGNTDRSISLTVGVPARRHDWPLNADPGWTLDGQWEFGTPLGSGGDRFGNPDPQSGSTGEYVYGVNHNGDFPPLPSGPFYLTTTPFDMSGDVTAILKFQRWLNTQGASDMSATIEVSNDGVNWENVWSNTDAVTDDAWYLKEYDISDIAADQPTVYLRWSYGVVQMTDRCSGWNIDDVEIWGVPESIRIELTMDAAEITWNAVPGSIGYDVVRGDLGTLRATGGDFTAATSSCMEDDVAGTTLGYTDTPTSSREGHWVLIRSVAGDGPLTYQTLAGIQEGLRDEEINAAVDTCP
jgi:hypothetical protein